MAADRRITAIRDVLVKGLRELAVRVASIELSDDEPTKEQVEQYVQQLQLELGLARDRGLVVPSNVAIYADARMLVAANREALSCVRLRLEDGTEAFFSPPPANYVLGSMAEEIERAAGEATPTQEIEVKAS